MASAWIVDSHLLGKSPEVAGRLLASNYSLESNLRFMAYWAILRTTGDQKKAAKILDQPISERDVMPSWLLTQVNRKSCGQRRCRKRGLVTVEDTEQANAPVWGTDVAPTVARRTFLRRPPTGRLARRANGFDAEFDALVLLAHPTLAGRQRLADALPSSSTGRRPQHQWWQPFRS